MSTQNNITSSAAFRAIEELAARRRDVRSFFDEDWSRLRAIIRELEEQAWDDVLASDDSGAESLGALIDERPVSSVSAEPLTTQSLSVESADRSEQTKEGASAGSPDRLSQLAAQIERQLRAAHREG
ncbi:MAG: hypothetical protein RIK87_28725 [Fuerstiella sp.]